MPGADDHLAKLAALGLVDEKRAKKITKKNKKKYKKDEKRKGVVKRKKEKTNKQQGKGKQKKRSSSSGSNSDSADSASSQAEEPQSAQSAAVVSPAGAGVAAAVSLDVSPSQSPLPAEVPEAEATGAAAEEARGGGKLVAEAATRRGEPPPTGARAEGSEPATKAELAAMRQAALRKRAIALGAEEAQLDACDDADDAHAAFVELVLALQPVASAPLPKAASPLVEGGGPLEASGGKAMQRSKAKEAKRAAQRAQEAKWEAAAAKAKAKRKAMRADEEKQRLAKAADLPSGETGVSQLMPTVDTGVGDAVSGAAASDPMLASQPIEYEPDQEVLYWSETKQRYTNAVVIRKYEKDGATVYELNVKGTVTPDKIRPKSNAANASSFASFATFDMNLVQKRSREPSDDELDIMTAKQKARMEADKPIDWSGPPAQLSLRAEVESGIEFIAHFVRFFLGLWRLQRSADFPNVSAKDRKAFEGAAVDQAQGDVEPLLRKLRNGENLEKGEAIGGRRTMCGGRTACDGRDVKEVDVLSSLELMSTLAAERDYSGAHQAYMRLTLGNKTWNNTCVTHVSANTMQGAREYRRNRDNLNTYDADPVAQKYMQALRKIVHFAQLVRPNDDQSKNVVL